MSTEAEASPTPAPSPPILKLSNDILVEIFTMVMEKEQSMCEEDDEKDVMPTYDPRTILQDDPTFQSKHSILNLRVTCSTLRNIANAALIHASKKGLRTPFDTVAFSLAPRHLQILHHLAHDDVLAQLPHNVVLLLGPIDPRPAFKREFRDVIEGATSAVPDSFGQALKGSDHPNHTWVKCQILLIMTCLETSPEPMCAIAEEATSSYACTIAQPVGVKFVAAMLSRLSQIATVSIKCRNIRPEADKCLSRLEASYKDSRDEYSLSIMRDLRYAVAGSNQKPKKCWAGSLDLFVRLVSLAGLPIKTLVCDALVFEGDRTLQSALACRGSFTTSIETMVFGQTEASFGYMLQLQESSDEMDHHPSYDPVTMAPALRALRVTYLCDDPGLLINASTWQSLHTFAMEDECCFCFLGCLESFLLRHKNTLKIVHLWQCLDEGFYPGRILSLLNSLRNDFDLEEASVHAAIPEDRQPSQRHWPDGWSEFLDVVGWHHLKELEPVTKGKGENVVKRRYDIGSAFVKDGSKVA